MTTKDSAEGLLREISEKVKHQGFCVRNYGARKNCDCGLGDILERITAFLSQSGEGWIKCSDRLPTKRDANEHGKVYVFVDGATAIDDWDWLHTPYAIKHDARWCRLPMPPEK